VSLVFYMKVLLIIISDLFCFIIFMTEAVEHPKSAQISSYLATNKRREFGSVGNVTLHSLQNAATMLQVLPENIDEGYVLGATFDPEDKSFVIVLSTIRMSTHNVGSIIYSDATYKCTWNNFPVIMMGCSDKNRRFHPIIVAISSHETHKQFRFVFETWKAVNPDITDVRYLMSDAAEASFNGGKIVIPNAKRVMCYPHFYRVRPLVILNTQLLSHLSK
jgi:MULE transposase domain